MLHFYSSYSQLQIDDINAKLQRQKIHTGFKASWKMVQTEIMLNRYMQVAYKQRWAK